MTPTLLAVAWITPPEPEPPPDFPLELSIQLAAFGGFEIPKKPFVSRSPMEREIAMGIAKRTFAKAVQDHARRV